MSNDPPLFLVLCGVAFAILGAFLAELDRATGLVCCLIGVVFAVGGAVIAAVDGVRTWRKGRR